MEKCLLWTKTADLAKDHGYEMSGSCPVDATCTGERCIFLAPIKNLVSEVDKFNARMDKTKTMQKLTELREELKKHKNKPDISDAFYEGYSNLELGS
jgi:hypothetical protein